MSDDFPVLDTSDLPERSRFTRYTDERWPLEELDVEQGFYIPLAEGLDPDGRPVSYIRKRVSVRGKRLGRRFSCTVADPARLIVKRTA